MNWSEDPDPFPFPFLSPLNFLTGLSTSENADLSTFSLGASLGLRVNKSAKSLFSKIISFMIFYVFL